MGGVIEILELWLHEIVELITVIFEYIGVAILFWSVFKGLRYYISRSPETKLVLGEGMTMSLSFLLGSEILRTVIAPNLQEILIIGGIILLRVALTLLLHWENTHEAHNLSHEEEGDTQEQK